MYQQALICLNEKDKKALFLVGNGKGIVYNPVHLWNLLLAL
jgi:hypothetical protein